MAKLNFQHHYSLVSLVSRDPSEIILRCWFDAQETFLINDDFVETVLHFLGLFYE